MVRPHLTAADSPQRASAAKELQKLNRELALETMEGLNQEIETARRNYIERLDQIKSLEAALGSMADKESLGNARFMAGEELRMAEATIEAKRKQADAQREATAAAERHTEVQQRIADFERQLTFDALQYGGERLEIYRQEFGLRLDLYDQLREEGLMTEKELADAQQEAAIKRMQAEQKATQETKKASDESKLNIMSNMDMLKAGMEMFASGMADALVDFISGTKSAGEAFKQFAVLHCFKRT